jgi:hypothetical protein
MARRRKKQVAKRVTVKKMGAAGKIRMVQLAIGKHNVQTNYTVLNISV